MDAKQTFDQLRGLAKLKCDQDIAFARQTMKERFAQIDSLERDLDCIAPTAVQNKTVRRKNGYVQDLIKSLIVDEPFTIDWLMTELQRSGQPMPKVVTVRQAVRRLVRVGELKEVINKTCRRTKKYAWPHVDANEPLPPLGETIVGILNAANAPMRPVEIAVQMIESGNPMEGEDPTVAVGKIASVLRDHPDKFRETDEGYWKPKT